MKKAFVDAEGIPGIGSFVVVNNIDDVEAGDEILALGARGKLDKSKLPLLLRVQKTSEPDVIHTPAGPVSSWHCMKRV